MFYKYAMLIELLILCALLVPPHSCIDYEDCGSEKAKLLDVKVSSCEEVSPCPLIRGNFTDLEITFEPLTDIENVMADVKGNIFNAYLPFMGVKKKGCVGSGLSCPLEAGKTYTYNNTIDVKKYFPPLKVGVMWKLMDKKDVILCAFIPAILV